MERFLLPIYVGTGLQKEKIWVVSLPPTGLQLIMDVEVEDIVAEIETVIGDELSCDSTPVYKMPQISLKFLCIGVQSSISNAAERFVAILQVYKRWRVPFEAGSIIFYSSDF